jgi:hypothetical protein
MNKKKNKHTKIMQFNFYLLSVVNYEDLFYMYLILSMEFSFC